MTARRTLGGFSLAAALCLPGLAHALSLPEAMAAAERANPALAQSRAQSDAAAARLSEARAGRLPSVVLSGESSRGSSDLGGFFGFGRTDVSPRGAVLELRQPLFAGGAINAAIERARNGRDAALAQVGGARALLRVQVAEAYAGVLSGDQLVALHQANVTQLEEIARQAALRFKDGETSRTDLDRARARLAEARAGLARASGDAARSRARFTAVVGAPPEGLEPLPAPPEAPATLDDAMAMALQSSPGLLAARASARAAEAGVRLAGADRLPSVALSAKASTSRDQFFPGYRADGYAVGVEGRWVLFSSGQISGRIGEARADARGAEAAVDTATAQVRETVVDAWQDVQTARAVVDAAKAQAAAAASALDSIRQEVRVGQRPASDLLDAEREALAASSALIAAQGEQVVSHYRLNAVLRGG